VPCTCVVNEHVLILSHLRFSFATGKLWDMWVDFALPEQLLLWTYELTLPCQSSCCCGRISWLCLARTVAAVDVLVDFALPEQLLLWTF
jgi:hypothetical protein